jgi:hypothetical protein
MPAEQEPLRSLIDGVRIELLSKLRCGQAAKTTQGECYPTAKKAACRLCGNEVIQ